VHPLALIAWLAPAIVAQAGDASAQTQVEVDAAVQRALELLVASQEEYAPDPPVGRMNADELAGWQAQERERLASLRREPGREWPYEGVYRVGGTIPAGYRVGGSAIVCSALLEAPGFEASEARRAAVARSLEFMLDELEQNELLAPGPKQGYDVRGWAHAYALHFFLRALERDVVSSEQQERVSAMVPRLLACLAANEIPEGGGWNYAGGAASSFMTASTLLALFAARDGGFEVAPGMVERGLAALERARAAETGAFGYSGARQEPMASSAARAAIAELCLLRAGRSDVARLRGAIAGFFDNWDHLRERKGQQGTHAPPYGIAPYYFYYGHTYAALAIEHLPEAERAEWRAKLRATLWRTREAHGGWNDRIFPRSESYSTAMAVLALIAPQLPAVPEWPSPEPPAAH
jgi:hypothetical protein